MKIIICLLAILLMACAPIKERMTQTSDVQSYRIYSEDGSFAGHIDKTNRVYDRDGNFIGMIRR